MEPASLVRARLFVLLVAGILASACAGPGAGGSRAAATPSVPPAAAGQGASPALDQPAAQSAAPACSGRPTPAQTEGPYFKAGSPERASLLEPGLQGTRLTLTGRVLSVGCQPLVGTVLDFWQADASGAYDNRGYRLRGHQLTGPGGAYALETIVPGQYPGRTEHIHVKVQPAGGPVLTTQLYFPGVARNQQDSIFDPALLVDMKDGAGGKTATYDFVVPVG